jgi:hypothetical protein
MVGDDDAVDPGLERPPGILGMTDPLQHDRQPRALAQKREILPGERGARVDLDEPPDARAEARRRPTRTGWAAPRDAAAAAAPPGRRPPRRPAGRTRDRSCTGRCPCRAGTAASRGPGPAGASRAAAGLCARNEALHELVRGAPVQLEPARGLAHRGRAALHRDRRLVGEDQRDALRGGRAGARQVGVAVRHLGDTHRGEQERRGQPPAEQLDARVAPGGVAQHPGDEPPAVERAAVGGNRRPGPRAARDVGERAAGEHALGVGLQPGEVGRDPRPDAGHAAEIDLLLAHSPVHRAATLAAGARGSGVPSRQPHSPVRHQGIHVSRPVSARR